MLYDWLYTTSRTPHCTILTEHRRQGQLGRDVSEPTMDRQYSRHSDPRIAVQHRVVAYPFSAGLEQRILLGMETQTLVDYAGASAMRRDAAGHC
jgi:hypothetical protein